MATSGRANTGSANGSYFYFQWQLVGQDVTNNTSTLNWQAGIHISGGEYWLTNAVRIDSGNVDYASIPAGTWSNVSGAGDHQLRSGTITIGHNADGTRNFSGSLNGWLYGYGTRSTYGAWDLPTIPRATQPSLPGSFDVGTAVTISLPRASGSFTHNVSYSFNGQSGTIATGAATSAVWNVPTALANTRPNNTSGTGVITVDTYNGGTYIGTKTAGFTATIPNTSAFQPTISNLVIAEANTDVSTHFGAYVQGKSQLHVTFDAAGVYSSTISKHVVGLLAPGATTVTYYEGNDITTDLLSVSGDYYLTAFPVDSRNRTSTITETITVEAYTAPAITSLSAIRANSSGVADDQGAYALVTMAGSITPLSNNNTVVYTLQYKKTTDTTWTSVNVTPATGYDLSGTQLLSGISVDYAYDIQLQAADYFTTTAAKTNVPTAFTTWDVHADGKGVSFGKVSDKAGRFEIGSGMPAHIITDTTTAADHNFVQLRRSDDTLLGAVATSDTGTGININMYDHTGAWAGKVSIAENGTITSPSTDSPGVVKMFAGSTAPSGWLICDGSSLLRTSYAALFAIIGTTYGSVDGTHFTLPDMRGRVGVGVGTATGAAGATAHTLGQKAGEETHVLSSDELPPISYRTGTTIGYASVSGSVIRSNNPSDADSFNYSSTHTVATPHNNMQPYVGLNYIIKT